MHGPVYGAETAIIATTRAVVADQTRNDAMASCFDGCGGFSVSRLNTAMRKASTAMALDQCRWGFGTGGANMDDDGDGDDVTTCRASG